MKKPVLVSVVLTSMVCGSTFALAQQLPAVAVVTSLSPMNPQILIAAAALVVALPPIVDGWIAQKVTQSSTLSILTMLVGVVFGSIGGGLTQLANGSKFDDALTVFIAGTISGIATGLVNYSTSKARKMAANADSRAQDGLGTTSVPDGSSSLTNAAGLKKASLRPAAMPSTNIDNLPPAA